MTKLKDAKRAFRALILKRGGYEVVAGQLGVSRSCLYNLTGEQVGRRPSLELTWTVAKLYRFDLRPWGQPIAGLRKKTAV